MLIRGVCQEGVENAYQRGFTSDGLTITLGINAIFEALFRDVTVSLREY